MLLDDLLHDREPETDALRVPLARRGGLVELVEHVRQAGVPFVGTLGRVCYHPCEDICKRGDWDEPVAICSLKRFAYDAAAGTYRLPEEHAFLLCSEGTDHFMGGLLHFAPVLLAVAPKVAA